MHGTATKLSIIQKDNLMQKIFKLSAVQICHMLMSGASEAHAKTFHLQGSKQGLKKDQDPVCSLRLSDYLKKELNTRRRFLPIYSWNMQIDRGGRGSFIMQELVQLVEQRFVVPPTSVQFWYSCLQPTYHLQNYLNVCSMWARSAGSLVTLFVGHYNITGWK